MKSDPERTPVLVAGAQLVQREAEPESALRAAGMLEHVARALARDAGASERALRELDTIAIVGGVVGFGGNPARPLAEALGARPAREMLTATGGEMPVVLVAQLAEAIREGSLRSALVLGAHDLRSLRRARKRGLPLDVPPQAGTPVVVGEERLGHSEEEAAYGLDRPSSVYPLFENALRARRGLDVETHRARMGALMSRLTCVAEENPYAWFPVSRSADELTTVTPENRMVAFPYTKYLNAVIDTDQAAGVWLMSAAAARSCGIPETRWVHPWGAASAVEEAWLPSQRPDFATCPALAHALHTALARAGVEPADLDALDLYSCFPVAVELGCEALGAAEDDPRGLSVTGGLPYAGGPGNHYTLHSLAAMLERLRARPGSLGLVTGNGWYLTKHSALVLGTEPPSREPRKEPVRAPAPPVPTATRADGPGRVLTYTVLYGRDGEPRGGVVIGRLDTGERFLAALPADPALLEDFVARERVGTLGRVAEVGGRHEFVPTREDTAVD